MAPTVIVQSLLDKLQFDFAAFEEEKSKAKAVTASDPAKDAILGGETLPSWYTGETKQLLGILLPKDRAQSWITGEQESWMVYVHGNKEPQNAELLRLSAAVATLIDAPQSNTEHIYQLGFFCGLHRMRDNGKRQIIDMMTSLSAQLLKMVLDRKVDIDLTRVEAELIKDGTFSEVLLASAFFAYVVSQLPEGSVVHCAVDNFLDYWNDKQPYDNDFEFVFSQLLRIVQAGEKVHTKLLLTCKTNGGQLDSLWGTKDKEKHVVDVDHPIWERS